MKNLSLKYIFVLMFLLLSCAVSWHFYFKTYRAQDTVDIHQFPKEIKGWVSKELPITDDEYAILETDNAFSRRYTSPEGKSVYLLLVYSQTNRKVSHPPEICYTGSGATVISNRRSVLDLKDQGQKIVSNKLLLEFANSKQVSCYWFKAGATFTPNYWKQQILAVANAFMGKPAGSALIRVSANVEGNNQFEAEQSIEDFSRNIVPALSAYLP